MNNNKKIIVGLDEVGRGPLVGDVVAGAVVLNPDNPIEGLTDSKKLSAKKREVLAEEIKLKALAWGIGRCGPKEIDQLNILQASLLAMQRAFFSLPNSIVVDLALIDGNHIPNLPCYTEAIIKGDSKIQEISAASIIAKVTRDSEMLILHEELPQYDFASHKGYPTKKHIAALEKYGLTRYHRKSYGPVKKLLKE